jgi:hypothetical protein
MKHHALRPINRFVLRMAEISRHPLVNVILGVGILIIGINEFIESVFPAFESRLDLHHAVILIGIVTLLHGVVEMVERMEKVVRSTTGGEE